MAKAFVQPRFKNYVDSLDALLQQLLGTESLSIARLPRNMPAAGVYLFSERRRHLYVGRTNRLRARLQEHCRPSSNHHTAPFAFTLARKATGKLRPSYGQDDSRRQLEKNPQFSRAFDRAKARVKRMDVRFVAEADPIRQMLLEVYVALALDTPFNDFDTH